MTFSATIFGSNRNRVGGGRIGRRQHPIRVRPAEGLDPREILEQAVGELAVERLVDAEQVDVSVQEGDRPVEASSSSCSICSVGTAS
jgi:hypothetical protein